MTWRRWGSNLVGERLISRWYARIDLGNLAGPTERDHRRPAIQPQIPDQARRNRNSDRRELTAGAEQLHYLYTLTPVGEQRRKFLLALAENDASHAESLYDLV